MLKLSSQTTLNTSNFMESELEYEIKPLTKLKSCYLSQISVNEKFLGKYAFQSFPKEQVKQQFRQIKRVKGFEMKDFRSTQPQGGYLPCLSISTPVLKDSQIFRMTNLRNLTFIWRSLLGPQRIEFRTRIISQKQGAVNIDQHASFGFSVSFTKELFSRANFILKTFREMRLQINFLEFYSKVLYRKRLPLKVDTKAYNPFNQELALISSLKRVSIKDIQTSILQFEKFDQFLVKNKNLEQIELEFDGLSKVPSQIINKVLLKLNPNMGLFDKDDYGGVILKKINGTFQLFNLRIYYYQNQNPSRQFLKLVENQMYLRDLTLYSTDYEQHHQTDFNSLVQLFCLLKSLLNLEKCSFKINSSIKKGDDLSKLGTILGEFISLKSFTLILEQQESFKFNKVKFVHNALNNGNSTLEEVNMDWESKRLNQQCKNNIQSNIQHSFQALRELRLVISLNESQINNIKGLLEKTSNLEIFQLSLQIFKFKENELESFSECFERMKKINSLQFKFYDTQIQSILSIVTFLDNINKCMELYFLELNFKQNNSIMNEQENVSEQEFKNQLKTENKSLKQLKIYFDHYLIDKIGKVDIMKRFSQIYPNVIKFETNIIKQQ